MTDRLRQKVPAPHGFPDAGVLAVRPRAVIVGAGIAGLTAATALAERGVAVQLIEQQAYLGGRVGGWTEHHQGAAYAMNRGFHAFFRQYYNLRNLLRRIDPQLRMLTAVDDYPLIDGAGRRDTFRGIPRTPPFNALAFALRSPTFRLRDLTRMDARAAAPLAAVSVPDVYHRLDHLDAETFLKSINFPQAARHLAFEVFSRSFFADPAQLSAAELATMFHLYFLGSNEGLIFDVANANFDECLWNPLRDYLRELGAEFQLGTSVVRIETGERARFQVYTDSGDSVEADAVVVATDIGGLRNIAKNSPELATPLWHQQIEGLRNAPPFAVHRLWLDRPVSAERAAFLGTSGHPPLDNISVVNRYEKQAARWANQHHGSVLELHSYALNGPVSQTEALRGLHTLYPETADAAVLHQQLLQRADCPLFLPGTYLQRPSVLTPQPALVLAGDGIRVDLPVALMERAATSGWLAGNHLLSHWGLAGHDLYTVPNRGRSTVLRSLALSQARTS